MAARSFEKSLKNFGNIDLDRLGQVSVDKNFVFKDDSGRAGQYLSLIKLSIKTDKVTTCEVAKTLKVNRAKSLAFKQPVIAHASPAT